MIHMTPSLIRASRIYAKRTGRTLSGLIAESLAEKIKRKASWGKHKTKPAAMGCLSKLSA
jgi:hypothetical protein